MCSCYAGKPENTCIQIDGARGIAHLATPVGFILCIISIFFLQCHCPRHKSLVILTSNVNDVRYYRFYLWPRTTLTEEGEPYYTDPDVLFLQDFLEFNSLHQQEGEVSV